MNRSYNEELGSNGRGKMALLIERKCATHSIQLVDPNQTLVRGEVGSCKALSPQ